jgi:hypothetical protein
MNRRILLPLLTYLSLRIALSFPIFLVVQSKCLCQLSSAVKELVTKMNIRLEIAKARKGLACALKEGNNVPPLCRIQLSCKLDVIDKDIYSELQEKLEKKEQSLKKDMLTEAVEFFGS